MGEAMPSQQICNIVRTEQLNPHAHSLVQNAAKMFRGTG